MPRTKEDLNEKQLAALQAIQKINNEQYDKKKHYSEHVNIFSISIGSHYFSIDFDINSINTPIRIPIYFSENDDRIYYEKSNKYEEWYSYIKRKFRDIKNELNDIKI